MDKNIALNPNEVVAFLQKYPRDFTRADMLRFICEKGIRMVDLLIRFRAFLSWLCQYSKGVLSLLSNLD